MYPHIRYQKNKKLDIDVATSFLNVMTDYDSSADGGIDFSKTIIDEHPALSLALNLQSKSTPMKVIRGYVKKFYRNNSHILLKSISDNSRLWSKCESQFFSITNRFFKSFPFPKGKYIGYISIFNCNPRFLSNKTFQVYYKHPDGAVYVTMHELLHFIFYAYTKKQYPRFFTDLDPDSGRYWALAEVFNAIILNDPSYRALHGVRCILPYPEHEKYVSVLSPLWEKEHSVDLLIKRGFGCIS